MEGEIVCLSESGEKIVRTPMSQWRDAPQRMPRLWVDYTGDETIIPYKLDLEGTQVWGVSLGKKIDEKYGVELHLIDCHHRHGQIQFWLGSDESLVFLLTIVKDFRCWDHYHLAREQNISGHANQILSAMTGKVVVD